MRISDINPNMRYEVHRDEKCVFQSEREELAVDFFETLCGVGTSKVELFYRVDKAELRTLALYEP